MSFISKVVSVVFNEAYNGYRSNVSNLHSVLMRLFKSISHLQSKLSAHQPPTGITTDPPHSRPSGDSLRKTILIQWTSIGISFYSFKICNSFIYRLIISGTFSKVRENYAWLDPKLTIIQPHLKIVCHCVRSQHYVYVSL